VCASFPQGMLFSDSSLQKCLAPHYERHVYYSLTLYNTMTTKNLIKELEILSQSKENTIEKAVTIEALESEDIRAFFSDLLQYGCVSGMVSSLICYEDTHSFFDTHYRQI
jgi:hypothetical protein